MQSEQGPARARLSSGTLLSVSGLRAGYGRRVIIDDVTFDARPGAVTAIVGHNGAGKSTLLRAIAGLLPATAGSVSLGGSSLERLSAAKRSRQGVALIPDGADGVFRDMSVADNLELSAVCARVTSDAARVGRITKVVEELFPSVLRDRRGQMAGSLSGGQRQMVAIAAALLRGPSLVMLDEPSLGLSPVLVEEVLEAVQHLVAEFDLSCLLVEQNVGAALGIADHMLVVKEGSLVRSFEKSDLPSVEALWELF